MACEDDCGMCGVCYEDWEREMKMEERCDYRLDMEFDNKPVYSETLEDVNESN